MPELPEVEVVCRGLKPHLIGQQIISIRQSGMQLRLPIPMNSMKKEMLTATIVDIERRAKYIQIFLSNGSMLIIHLGMTGNLGIFPRDKAPVKHDHVIWSLSNDKELRYHDVRRFGFLVMLEKGDVDNREKTVFKTSGPEPFSEEFNGAYLFRKAKNRDVMIKTFIMDSRIVVGVGNIYANESLFSAGIRPSRKVTRVTKKQWSKLVETIRAVLSHAIECGGSTINDFLNASQQSGYFQMNFQVYGRTNAPCFHCNSLIKNKKITGRTSFYCPQCQQ